MVYQDLGSRGPVMGVSDANYQINPFNLGTGWDVVIDPTVINSNLTQIEAYQAFIDGPVGSAVMVFRNGKKWNFVPQGWQNYWDPIQPLPLGQTDTITFCWSVPFTSGPYNRTSNVQPEVTLWLRQQLGGG
jgi:hypothetical protein